MVNVASIEQRAGGALATPTNDEGPAQNIPPRGAVTRRTGRSCITFLGDNGRVSRLLVEAQVGDVSHVGITIRALFSGDDGVVGVFDHKGPPRSARQNGGSTGICISPFLRCGFVSHPKNNRSKRG